MKYYTKENTKHAYGNYDKLSQELLREVDRLAIFLGQELLITSGYRPKDPNSQHRLGFAVDVVPTKAIALLDLYLAAERYNFKGLGVYPDWSNGQQITGGLHLDMRAADTGARWLGVRVDGKNQYLALSSEMLKKYGII